MCVASDAPAPVLVVIRLIRIFIRKKKERKKKKRHARIELAGYQARVQQFTSENPVIPRDGAPLMPLGRSTFYSEYIPKNTDQPYQINQTEVGELRPPDELDGWR